MATTYPEHQLLGPTLTLVFSVDVQLVFPVGVLVVQRPNVVEDTTLVYGKVLRIAHTVLDQSVTVKVVVRGVDLGKKRERDGQGKS